MEVLDQRGQLLLNSQPRKDYSVTTSCFLFFSKLISKHGADVSPIYFDPQNQVDQEDEEDEEDDKENEVDRLMEDVRVSHIH